MENKLLFAITTYNDLEYTKMCLETLEVVKDVDLDIIIIDDYSDDDTVSWWFRCGDFIIKSFRI